MAPSGQPTRFVVGIADRFPLLQVFVLAGANSHGFPRCEPCESDCRCNQWRPARRNRPAGFQGPPTDLRQQEPAGPGAKQKYRLYRQPCGDSIHCMPVNQLRHDPVCPCCPKRANVDEAKVGRCPTVAGLVRRDRTRRKLARQHRPRCHASVGPLSPRRWRRGSAPARARRFSGSCPSSSSAVRKTRPCVAA